MNTALCVLRESERLECGMAISLTVLGNKNSVIFIFYFFAMQLREKDVLIYNFCVGWPARWRPPARPSRTEVNTRAIANPEVRWMRTGARQPTTARR